MIWFWIVLAIYLVAGFIFGLVSELSRNEPNWWYVLLITVVWIPLAIITLLDDMCGH